MTSVLLSTFRAGGPVLANHLLQSTIFLVVAALLVLELRPNRAQTRYWVWFAASVKFLIPFAPLVSLGSHLGWSLPPVAEPSFFYLFLDTSSRPAESLTRALIATPHISASAVPFVLVAVWFIGFFAVLAKWRLEWRRARSLVSASRPIREGQAVEILRGLQKLAGLKVDVRLMRSETAVEPCVFGLWRPILLLPQTILDQLKPPELETILAHELSHIRRRDNLLASIHMLVQAIFWFHPLVWWLRVKLLNERERACDEAVLDLGTEPTVYAESILRVCRLCLTAPRECVSGVTGSGLKRRIESIMSEPMGRKLDGTRRALLGLVGVIAIVGPIATGLMHAPRAAAQLRDTLRDTGTLPKFEFITIKPSKPDTGMSVDFASGGRLTIRHATLRFLMKVAYELNDDQIEGGPAWLGSRRFDLEAKPETPFGGDQTKMSEDRRRLFREQVRLRLQSLLADRFQLKLRSESKQMPIFALVVGKNGPKMERSSTAGAPEKGKLRGGHGDLIATRVNMNMFAGFLSEGQVGRPVVNETSLTGDFDFRMQWSPDQGPATDPLDSSAAPPGDTAGGLSIFTALQQQLGLKLEPRKSTAECVVVERAELPPDN